MISLKMNLMEPVIRKKVLKESLKRSNLRSRRQLRRKSLKRHCLSYLTVLDVLLRTQFHLLYAQFAKLLGHQWKSLLLISEQLMQHFSNRNLAKSLNLINPRLKRRL